MRRITFLVAAVLAPTALTVRAADGADARPLQDQLLFADATVTYEAPAADGAYRVSWQIELQNNDSSTAFDPAGGYYYYFNYGVPVLRGASNMQAYGPTGGALGLSTEDPSPESAVVFSVVEFDQDLTYGETYSFTLSYELENVHLEGLLITPYYAYFPLVAGLDDTTVRIVTPDDPAWDVSIEQLDCEEASAGEYSCGPGEFTPFAAVVEVMKPDEQRERARAVALNDGEIDVVARYFPGQGDWANHALDVAEAGLPVLEDLYGYSYPGGPVLQIVPRGQRELSGYAGYFECLNGCAVSVSPIVDDHVLLHEMAHAWTLLFYDRWLQEGFAEFMSRRAAREIDGVPLRLDGFEWQLWPELDLQLSTWNKPTFFVAQTEDEERQEETGYAKSFRFVRLLAREYGLVALQDVNAAMAAEVEIDVDEEGKIFTRGYLDWFEDVTGERADDLFLEWVFLPGDAGLLEDRRAARERFAELEFAVDYAGLELEGRAERMLEGWQFDRAMENMEAASSALDAYVEAYETVDAERDLWTEFGLLYHDPDTPLDEATEAFNSGAYEKAGTLAIEAQASVDDADRLARYRAAVALSMSGAMALLVGLLFLTRPRRT